MAGYFDNALAATSGNDRYVYMPMCADLNNINSDTDAVRDSEQYRPDRIARRVYGDELLDWVLDEANNFSHGGKEYISGTKIKIPKKTELQKLGIL